MPQDYLSVGRVAHMAHSGIHTPSFFNTFLCQEVLGGWLNLWNGRSYNTTTNRSRCRGHDCRFMYGRGWNWLRCFRWESTCDLFKNCNESLVLHLHWRVLISGVDFGRIVPRFIKNNLGLEGKQLSLPEQRSCSFSGHELCSQRSGFSIPEAVARSTQFLVA